MADEKIIASYPPYAVGVLRCVKDWQLKSSDFSAVQGSMGESSGTLQRVSFVVREIYCTVSAEYSVYLDAWRSNGGLSLHYYSTTTPYIFTPAP